LSKSIFHASLVFKERSLTIYSHTKIFSKKGGKMYLKSANQGLKISQEEAKKGNGDKTDNNELSKITKTGGEDGIEDKTGGPDSNSI
jgi:hypothetical protein